MRKAAETARRPQYSTGFTIGTDKPHEAAGKHVAEHTDPAQKPANEAPPKSEAEKGGDMLRAANEKTNQPAGTVDFDAHR